MANAISLQKYENPIGNNNKIPLNWPQTDGRERVSFELHGTYTDTQTHPKRKAGMKGGGAADEPHGHPKAK